MLYQLPSGKVVYLSLEEYLAMSDQDLHHVVHSGRGEEPFFNSYFNTKSRLEKKVDSEKDKKDDTPDYEPDI